MSEARVNNLSNESNTGGPTISGITTFSGTNFFVPPKGDTASRPENPQKGAIRFNTDSAKLEYFRGNTIGWVEVEASHGQLGGGTGSNTGLGVRGLFTSRSTSPGTYVNTVDFITISTAGNAQDFGDTIGTGAYGSTFSSTTRGILGAGHPNSNGSDTIQFFTIASTGNATDFGNLTSARWLLGGGVSNQTRGIFAGGSILTSGNPTTNVLDYVEIASTGNAVDFGDQTQARRLQASVNSSTRGLFAGGYHPATYNIIEYITTATLGNAVDFGDLTGALRQNMGVCNSTRGVFAGCGSPVNNVMEYVTIATLGNAADFGDLNAARFLGGGASAPTRGVFAGGYSPNSPTATNVIEYIQILTTGNATDFGDLTVASFGMGGISNGHGGL